jgi:uncharacterized repeat protein (TIGR02543 family)
LRDETNQQQIPDRSIMKTQFIHVAISLALAATSGGQTVVVSSVVDTGLYNIFEMSLNPTTGGIYVDGYASGSSELSIQAVTGASLTPLYSPLPGTSGGNLAYTNGFAVHGSNLWWNNANSGPGTATEISQAAAAGGGAITRTSPSNDLDSLASDGTTLFIAHYAGSLYSVTGAGALTSLGFHRSTSHLAIAAEGGVLYVADDSGIYRRNADGSYTDFHTAANRYFTNGSRMGVGGGYVYALDRNTHNGFWKIDKVTGTATFITDPSFTNLNAIAYYNGDLYVSDPGELAAQPNTNGHVWKISTGYSLSASADHGTLTGTGLYAAGAMAALSVTPAPGYVFSAWSGDATGSDNPVSILMNANKTVTATFGQDGADNDTDGLTNYQEIVVYGSNPAISDTDGDGFADGYEVTRNFSPTSDTSSPDSQIVIYTAVEVEFGAGLGRTYRVESSTDLQSWLPVESGIQGTGGQISRLYSTRSFPHRYFRAVRE